VLTVVRRTTEFCLVTSVAAIVITITRGDIRQTETVPTFEIRHRSALWNTRWNDAHTYCYWEYMTRARSVLTILVKSQKQCISILRYLCIGV